MSVHIEWVSAEATHPTVIVGAETIKAELAIDDPDDLDDIEAVVTADGLALHGTLDEIAVWLTAALEAVEAAR